ncbi:nicotinamide riboside transporter PnuC [Mumia sp. zg.B53]|uniref:nicotinamide riboside transporter PnuC n=1 Tax=unclassified Mumia TaxID=2621872 RepID=UPI001C6E0902|nr:MULTISPECIES: nicotinamide riboside transporter PnuC [unclassified Mumia]MBW9206013.1 nicotinamide riboside transporter PnuC [Mumia sp. zg.B17]MBW9211705.1 nicotinamide riboside transporter PnuC [Mumia sp. zg.B21]MBW9216865.1 nicotinamide riboside transporter PnuC [Mumia sp. zg.B53]MDD9347427.1 nicotinamide riboside transporter PnuC [Mumia sp.]
MSVLIDLYDAHLTIGGHPIAWREIAGNGFGLASAIGGMRRKVWAWPVGIVGNVLLFTVFLGTALGGYGAPLFGQAARQVFFVAVSVYGWYRWRSSRTEPDAPAVVPRWATRRERTAYLLAGAIAVVFCAWLFTQIGAGWPAPGWYYVADAWIFVGSILATFAMARGWVDFWLVWIAVDLVGVPELIYFQYYPSAVLYAVYAGFVVWGFVVWRRAARDEAPRIDDPRAEAVA